MLKTLINYFSSFFRIFGLDEGINLIPDGDNELVTIHNVEVNYIITTHFQFNSLIKKTKKLINRFFFSGLLVSDPGFGLKQRH